MMIGQLPDYAASRDGIISQFVDEKTKTHYILTLRQMLKALPEEKDEKGTLTNGNKDP